MAFSFFFFFSPVSESPSLRWNETDRSEDRVRGKVCGSLDGKFPSAVEISELVSLCATAYRANPQLYGVISGVS